MRPPDGAQIAADLHTLLHRGHAPGPYDVMTRVFAMVAATALGLGWVAWSAG